MQCYYVALKCAIWRGTDSVTCHAPHPSHDGYYRRPPICTAFYSRDRQWGSGRLPHKWAREKENPPHPETTTLDDISCCYHLLHLNVMCFEQMKFWFDFIDLSCYSKDRQILRYCLYIKLWPNIWTERTVLLPPDAFSGSKLPTKCVCGWALPRTSLGSLQRSPRRPGWIKGIIVSFK